MASYYIVFNHNDSELVSPLKALNFSLSAKHVSASGSTFEDKIKSADFLVLLLSSPADLELPHIKQASKLFQDEIAWKRKKFGEIIFLVANDDFDFSRIAYKLRGLSYFTFEEIKDISAYFTSQYEIFTAVPAFRVGYSYTPKVIEYKPHESAVKQIEFSIRAPKVESFDNFKKIGYSVRQDAGCKTDHVFEGIAPNASKKKFVEEELNRPTPVSRTVNADKPPKKKTSTVGCVLIILLFLAVVITLAVIIGNNVRGASGYTAQINRTNIAMQAVQPTMQAAQNNTQATINAILQGATTK